MISALPCGHPAACRVKRDSRKTGDPLILHAVHNIFGNVPSRPYNVSTGNRYPVPDGLDCFIYIGGFVAGIGKESNIRDFVPPKRPSSASRERAVD